MVRVILAHCLAWLLPLVPAIALAVPPRMPTHGVLRDGTGNLAPDGEYGVVFTLHTAEKDGNVVWTESRKIQLEGVPSVSVRRRQKSAGQVQNLAASSWRWRTTSS